MLKKVHYEQKVTRIDAKNLNDIQDSILALEDGLFSVDNEKSGEFITITDAAKRGFRSFRIFGQTTQGGIPTPDSYVDFESVGSTDKIGVSGSITVYVTGENDAQSMTIATPNGLRGIPVADGGNYTDESGQQWVCDEIDLDRGVYVRRIGKSIVDGVSNPASKNDESSLSYLYYSRVPDKKQNTPGLCSHFTHFDGYPSRESNYGNFNVTTTAQIVFFCGYGIVTGDNSKFSNADEFNNWLIAQNEAGTPVTVLYVLANPIETPLSSEEIDAYVALHTYKDSTAVSNDSFAHMKLEYVMDAKKYIDSLVGSSAELLEATVE